MVFFMIFWILFKLPLRVPLSPAEISLNGSMVLNDTEWYPMVISGIPLALFCKRGNCQGARCHQWFVYVTN